MVACIDEALALVRTCFWCDDDIRGPSLGDFPEEALAPGSVGVHGRLSQPNRKQVPRTVAGKLTAVTTMLFGFR